MESKKYPGHPFTELIKKLNIRLFNYEYTGLRLATKPSLEYSLRIVNGTNESDIKCVDF